MSNITRVNLNWVNKYWFNKSTPKFVYKENVFANTGKSSCQEVFCRKGVLRKFAELTGNTCTRVSWVFLWIFPKFLWTSFFTEHLRPATLLKKTLWHRGVPVNFAKFLRTPFFLQNTFGGCFCTWFSYPTVERIVAIANISVFMFTRILKFVEIILLEGSFYVLYYFPLEGIGTLSSEYKIDQADF